MGVTASGSQQIGAGRWGRSRTGRTRGIWARALVPGIGVLVLTACGGSDGPTTSEMLDGVPIEEAVATLGGQCELSGTQGRSNCAADGVSFQLIHNSWVSQAGQRERECDTEQVSPATEVLTNRSWVIHTDDPEDLGKLQVRLEEVGAPSQIKGYCDWDADSGGKG